MLAWSWGVSRIIDVIEQSGGNLLQADAMAVAGCSRFGKAAFTIGASSGDPPAVITASGNATGNLGQWRNWTTPTLQ